MRTKWGVITAAVAVLGLVLVGPAAAHQVSVSGSLTITGPAGAEPTGLVGVAVVANPGYEKTITLQIPPFTLPVFIDGDRDDDDGSATSHHGWGERRLDTTLVLVNSTGSALSLEITVRDRSGTILANDVPVSLAAHETKVVQVSDLLP